MRRCIYAICQHPEVEARVSAELAAAGLMATPERLQPRCMEHADLARLPYLQCVIKVGSFTEPGVPACAPIICTVEFLWHRSSCNTKAWLELHALSCTIVCSLKGVTTEALRALPGVHQAAARAAHPVQARHEGRADRALPVSGGHHSGAAHPRHEHAPQVLGAPR